MSIIGFIVDIVLKVIKFLWGTDKPIETEVINAKPEKPIGEPSPDDMLADLGLRIQSTDRTGDEGSLHDNLPGEADASTGKHEGQGTAN